jgi:protoporphyrinogen oxidase
LNSVPAFAPQQRFAVIIVGAGLAGLAAACALKDDDHPVLVLEEENRLGGKVRTRNQNGITYETGALFAFDRQWVPFPVATGPLEEGEHPVGLFHQGRLLAGDSVTACLQGLQPELRHMLCLRFFLAASAPQPELVGDDLRAALSAFFRVIHPGDLHEYIPARRGDSLITHQTSRFQAGNATLVQAMAANSGAAIRTGCRVCGLERSDNELVVTWRTNGGKSEQAIAERVILAVPAVAAKALCRKVHANVATDFLGRIRYGAGIVVVLHCSAVDLRPFSYVVSTQGQVNTFIFHHSPQQSGEVLLTAYLVAEQAIACRNHNDAELAAIVLAELNDLGIGVVTPAQIAFCEVIHWPEVGPIIDPQGYRGFAQAWLRPMSGVVLAGDYTWWDEQGMPYGMWAAIASGRRAATLCREPVIAPVRTDFAATPLATTIVTRITDDGPVFSERLTDGTVAYYGLLLKTLPNLDLEHYLLGEAVNSLWGYQQGYGVTSLDSALVLEGLLATGRHSELLHRSCRRLMENFYDEQAGAFWTIPLGKNGRAPYWRGPDCPATAACGWLLQQIDPTRYAQAIARCRHYLLGRQRVNGSWPGKWFPSANIPVWYAVRFLATLLAEDDIATAASVRRAALNLITRQEQNGSWAGSVIETSAALLAFEALGGHDKERAKGQAWLRAVKGREGWHGEPILEYWFDEGGQRTFFQTSDNGMITSAWATLALNIKREYQG